MRCLVLNLDDALERWRNRADMSLMHELDLMSSNPRLLKDAFYRELSFGTGGLRGIIGAGPNRMNTHTVARATQGLANYLTKHFDTPSVAIARDSRRMGKEFVTVAAEVLAANGVRSFLYPRIEPTPALSWAVRDLGCSAGICITASHNPAIYNGYKVYGADGCQITTQAAEDIQSAIDAVDLFDGPKRMKFSEAESANLVKWLNDDVLDRYLKATLDESLSTSKPHSISVVYTPLHGAGLECVTRVLERMENIDITIEPTQAAANGDFPTCPYPNPEVREALELGLALCEESRSDLLLATDPDADRVGIAVAHNGKYQLLTGNEVGVLLLDYVCNMLETRGENLSDRIAISTVVSGAMADTIARERGFQLRRTLTGFKYIGEQIGLLEASDQSRRFLFGFEESYGYLAGTHVRDKDAVVASMLICEMAQWHLTAGHDLVEAMDSLYRRYGFHRNCLITIEYPGAEGAERMAEIMEAFRKGKTISIANRAITSTIDYSGGIQMPIVNPDSSDAPQQLPPANLVELQLEGGGKFMVRPSGTEPKVKAYLFAEGGTAQKADDLLRLMRADVTALLS